ncbi:MAG TPA: MAPEG family protein [Quisquiliibacterium sp.]|mgnify:CR=1 FL=1|nr:MAG: hypothetical protein E6Q93_28640 [Burkholderiaceae bacterium]HOA94456.1 MAPEG family protein [Quisquiliibacterium sp.]HPA88896.1 MAPEG family protein [Quisquiliibacterium sp.]HQD83804.1 MAPEG family protein [Quisquiliibacterium sp.]HQN12159.1 MAPEG family protein [Quisquiliibacterium sp.]
MNIALACVLTAGVLPIVAAVVSKWGFRGYDNRNPRAWLAGQTGFRARANAAQANSWEAFAFFAPGALAALWAQAPQARVDALALAFIAARVLYLVLYVADRATLRSLVWTVGWGCSVALYVSAL